MEFLGLASSLISVVKKTDILLFIETYYFQHQGALMSRTLTIILKDALPALWKVVQ